MAWNYAPEGRNVITDRQFGDTENTFVKAGPDRIGSTYTKCLYQGYTDASVTRRLPRPADERYLGLLGPVIRAQVGDTIRVIFRNNCSFPASIHPHGVFYSKRDVMVVTARGKARADGSTEDVDREIFALFEVADENKTHYIEAERTRLPQPPDAGDEEFVESNLMHSINGYVYGNEPLITMHRHERVRWYLMGMGTEVDLHTPHWHGNTVTVAGMRMHVNDHITAGMLTRYEVIGTPR